jgi:hypothetical protein
MPLKECIHNLTHSLLQRGDQMRKVGYGRSPSATKNITSSSSPDGRTVRKDSVRQPYIPDPLAHDLGAVHAGTVASLSDISSRSVTLQQAEFSRRKKDQPWRRHQSVSMIVSGSGCYCKYKIFPGFNNVRGRPYTTKYRCEECSMENGTDFWLCNTVEKVGGIDTVVSCHLRYH